MWIHQIVFRHCYSYYMTGTRMHCRGMVKIKVTLEHYFFQVWIFVISLISVNCLYNQDIIVIIVTAL